MSRFPTKAHFASWNGTAPLDASGEQSRHRLSRAGNRRINRALHIMGSLGTTNLTPLQAMWASAPTMAILDGVDEVHKVTVARNVLKSYRPHDGYWPTEYFPAKRTAAREKFEPMFKADPELREIADGYARYIAQRA